jgi:hypothetical protein
MASYLEPLGEERLRLYKGIFKLYNQRSIAAHTAQEIESEPLLRTYGIMHNVLVKIIDTNHVPTQSELETLLLCGDSTGIPESSNET